MGRKEESKAEGWCKPLKMARRAERSHVLEEEASTVHHSSLSSFKESLDTLKKRFSNGGLYWKQLVFQLDFIDRLLQCQFKMCLGWADFSKRREQCPSPKSLTCRLYADNAIYLFSLSCLTCMLLVDSTIYPYPLNASHADYWQTLQVWAEVDQMLCRNNIV